MAQALYACVRAGKLDEAIDLTKKAQQPWRAATIRGSTLFQWRGICAYFCGILQIQSLIVHQRANLGMKVTRMFRHLTMGAGEEINVGSFGSLHVFTGR